ncbi:MAG: aryl-sulfate sulfotransferase, partial [Thermoguttaceae bacterium]|nr:aryl-sulfate sulfotransferase [Thermoguttaceae bacterium]
MSVRHRRMSLRSLSRHGRSAYRLSRRAGLRFEELEDRRLLSVVDPVNPSQTVGLFLNDAAKAFEGYTLFAPSTSTTTYLIDNQGRAVHTWQSNYTPGQSAYLLEDGSLLRTAAPQPGLVGNWAPGLGGRIEQYSWDGNLVWSYDLLNTQYASHHDIEPLPNGNILVLVWEYKSASEAIAAGRDPALLSDGKLIPDSVFEIQPSGSSGGNVVWEWHVWDHLIQDRFPDKANYGNVAAHPELVDINYVPSGTGAGGVPSDWTHMNGIDYNAQFDQILLSVREFSEVWVIDHSTTTEEAAGHTGGNSGKGGDLLYRWGNPRTYRAGTAADQTLFYQHNAEWTDTGTILVFNNGWGRPDGNYSSADEFAPPVDGNGNYTREGAAFGPSTLVWSFTATEPTDFFAPIISGTYRLPNGNTLITEGTTGTMFEVTPAKEIVWCYVNPVLATGPLTQGAVVPALPVAGFPNTYLNMVFRSYRYAPDYAGLVGRDLTPGDPIEVYPPYPLGLFDSAGTRFILSESTPENPGAANDFSFNVNLPGWFPLIGDWNNDGTDTVGLFDPFTTTFYLKDSNNTTPGDVTTFSFHANLSGWSPLVGDWNGDGVDTIGVFDPFTTTFYLKDSNNADPSDVTVFGFRMNLAGWFPLAGDWNHDGIDTVGLFDPFTATFYLKDSNNTTPGDVTTFSFHANLSGWFPLVGDWNGDGVDTIGVFNPLVCRYYLKDSNNATPGDVAE